MKSTGPAPLGRGRTGRVDSKVLIRQKAPGPGTWKPSPSPEGIKNKTRSPFSSLLWGIVEYSALMLAPFGRAS